MKRVLDRLAEYIAKEDESHPEDFKDPTQVDKHFGITVVTPPDELAEPFPSGFQKKRRFELVRYVDSVDSSSGEDAYCRPFPDVLNAYKNVLLFVLALEGPCPCRLEPSVYYRLENVCLVDATYVNDVLNNTVIFPYMDLPPCRIPIRTLYQFVDKDCNRKDLYAFYDSAEAVGLPLVDVQEAHIDIESLFHVVADHFNNILRLPPLSSSKQSDDSPSSSEEEEFDSEESEESAEESDIEESDEESAEDSEFSYSDEDKDS